MNDQLSHNEHIKEASAYLRGTLDEGLRQEITGAISEDDAQLVKFHGMYLQDDRDLRPERSRKKMEKGAGLFPPSPAVALAPTSRRARGSRSRASNGKRTAQRAGSLVCVVRDSITWRMRRCSCRTIAARWVSGMSRKTPLSPRSTAICGTWTVPSKPIPACGS